MKNQVLYLFPGGARKILTMSYDDGAGADRRLVEIFNRYGIRGTFHLNSQRLLQGEGAVPAREAAALYRGHEIAVHTVHHPMINQVPPQQMVREILEDREALEQLTGYPVRGMSYPYGVYNDALVQLLPSLDIEYSRTTQSTGGYTFPNNFLLWNPTCRHTEKLLERGEFFLRQREMNVLFYVWGHSFEFDQDNNWQVMEDFCKMMAGDPLIWYATNIEIVDYRRALESLKFSADGGMVYNPTCLTLWLETNGQICTVEPGKTLLLPQGPV